MPMFRQLEDREPSAVALFAAACAPLLGAMAVAWLGRGVMVQNRLLFAVYVVAVGLAAGTTGWFLRATRKFSIRLASLAVWFAPSAVVMAHGGAASDAAVIILTAATALFCEIFGEAPDGPCFRPKSVQAARSIGGRLCSAWLFRWPPVESFPGLRC